MIGSLVKEKNIRVIRNYYSVYNFYIRSEERDVVIEIGFFFLVIRIK